MPQNKGKGTENNDKNLTKPFKNVELMNKSKISFSGEKWIVSYNQTPRKRAQGHKIRNGEGPSVDTDDTNEPQETLDGTECLTEKHKLPKATSGKDRKGKENNVIEGKKLTEMNPPKGNEPNGFIEKLNPILKKQMSTKLSKLF